MKILMVCLGNICRSPLAEGIMKEKLKCAGLQAIVDSAGMIDYHCGDAPDHRSIEIARNHGIDISSQAARKFSISDFDNFDLVFAMDESVYEEIVELAKGEEQIRKVHLFLDFAEWREICNVPDPYYGNKSDFEKVYQLLDASSDKVIEKLLHGEY